MNARFAGSVAVVSAGAALAASTLIEGWGGENWPLLGAGVILGFASVLGLLILVRAVALDRRRDGRR